MRTTLTIDDELMAQIEEIRRRDGLTMRSAINQLLREGIERHRQPAAPRPYRMPTRRLGLKPGFDATRLNQLVDELDIEDFPTRGSL